MNRGAIPDDVSRILRGLLLVASKIADTSAKHVLPRDAARTPTAHSARLNIAPPVVVNPTRASQKVAPVVGALQIPELTAEMTTSLSVQNVQRNQAERGEEVSVHEPETHGLQGVSVVQQDADTSKKRNKKKQFTPRERAVPSSSIGRAFGFASLGATILLGTAKDTISRAWRGQRADDETEGGQQGLSLYSAFISETNAERLAEAMCRMRGAAMKLGQMLSIQDENILPPQFSAALERVRAGADVMPRRQLHKTLSSALGKDWRQRVAEFDDLPMAAASIGQVHAATLHDGREVVMKIQYPGVKKSIESDVDNLMRLIKLGNLLPKGLYVENAVAVVKKELAMECDYRWEAEAQARFVELVALDSSLSGHFRVPAVIPELSSEQVLTTERAPGVHIDQVVEMDQSVRDAVGTRLLALTLTELYDWQFMQTDPNFGNFLYDADSDILYLIDFGAAKEYSLDFVSDYLEMVKACAERNAEEIVSRSTALGFLTGDESQVMTDAHVEAAIVVGTPFATVGLHNFGAHGELTRRVTELGAIMLKHRLTPPPDESYSLHRKLSGAFLACIKLKARVPCRELFYAAYDRHRARLGQQQEQQAAVVGE